MLRRFFRTIKSLLWPFEEYSYTEVGPIEIVVMKNRGLLRSVDKHLGYRKEKSQARNWKRRWRH